MNTAAGHPAIKLRTHYEHLVHGPHFVADPGQGEAVDQLQQLAERLAQPRPDTWANRLGRRLGRLPAPEQGLYLWGGVGRGKTWLMDLFHEALPFEDKLRLHFHHFMQQIHDELAQQRGQRNPLPLVAHHFAQRTRVLCLDEFYVEDITDAMILYRLLDALIRQGVTLVITSNLQPQQLYQYGLQRERFLPAIALLQQHTTVIHLDGDSDHRLQKLRQSHTYFSPLHSASEAALHHCFTELAPNAGNNDVVLNIHHRPIIARQCADDVAWFDFHQLCHGPRASADYIELAKQFHTVLISGVPIMGEKEEEWAHRFVDLIDEFYDRRVKLLLSAETEPQHLYRGRRLSFEFQRTTSRLMEMRSDEYLAQPHRP
jgi:cell division protein ZapE